LLGRSRGGCGGSPGTTSESTPRSPGFASGGSFRFLASLLGSATATAAEPVRSAPANCTAVDFAASALRLSCGLNSSQIWSGAPAQAAAALGAARTSKRPSGSQSTRESASAPACPGSSASGNEAACAALRPTVKRDYTEGYLSTSLCKFSCSLCRKGPN